MKISPAVSRLFLVTFRCSSFKLSRVLYSSNYPLEILFPGSAGNFDCISVVGGFPIPTDREGKKPFSTRTVQC